MKKAIIMFTLILCVCSVQYASAEGEDSQSPGQKRAYFTTNGRKIGFSEPVGDDKTGYYDTNGRTIGYSEGR